MNFVFISFKLFISGLTGGWRSSRDCLRWDNGNESTTYYLAETFSWTVLDPSSLANEMIKSSLPRLLGIYLVMLVSGCRPPPPSLILSSSCEPPCWHSITPGVTTKQESIEILTNLATIDSGSVYLLGHPWKIFDDVIHFSLQSKGEGNIYIINDVVEMIFVLGDLSTSLGQAVDKFGKPHDLLVFGSLGKGSLFFEGFPMIILALNPDQGVAFGYDTSAVKKAWRDQIRPEIRLGLVAYFNPAYYEKLLDAGMFSMGTGGAEKLSEDMRPWPGYGKIPELDG